MERLVTAFLSEAVARYQDVDGLRMATSRQELSFPGHSTPGAEVPEWQDWPLSDIGTFEITGATEGAPCGVTC